MAVPVINIGSKADLKGFKQAETASQKLGKTVKSLGAAFGLAFGARAVVQFGKASVKAFSQDEAAAKKLTQAVTNLGLGFENVRITKFIGDLEKSANVADDVLRPAFQALITTTRDSAKSQELLNLALDISAGSGENVVSVANDLSKAYVGTTKGLVKYNIGLTKAELSTKSFAELQEILNEQFSGQNAARLETYAGKIDALNVSFGISQEIIGKGLVDAFILLSGDEGIGLATEKMETFAQKISDAVVGAADLIKQLGDIGSVAPVDGSQFKLAPSLLDELAGRGQKVLGTDKQYGGIYATRYQAQQDRADAKARAKATADELKRQKEILAAKNKQLATQKKLTADKKKQEILDKAALVLAQGKKVFDEEGIQLAAAAQGRLTEEERARLALKTDIFNLEAAINEENITAAARLANSMVANAQKLATLRGDMIGLNDIQNPFTNWLETLKQMALELSKLANIKPATIIPMPSYTTEPLYKYNTLSQQLVPGDTNRSEMGYGGGQFDYNITPSSPLYGYNSLSQQSMAASNGTVVNISVAGSVTTERDLVAAITQGLYSQQASGTPVLYSTVY
jgi:hypothetical protein